MKVVMPTEDELAEIKAAGTLKYKRTGRKEMTIGAALFALGLFLLVSIFQNPIGFGGANVAAVFFVMGSGFITICVGLSRQFGR